MFIPENWYWQAFGGRLYSSAKQVLIKETDKDFIAWLKAGKLPTPWPEDKNGQETDAALSQVLAAYGLEMFPPTLADIKAKLQVEIDQAAETERLKYITDGVGQSMTYQEKVNQAASYSGSYAAYLAHPETTPKPNDDEYLLLKASLGIDGDTVLEVAETVTYAYLQWQQIGAGIEATRLKAKAAIDAVETQEAAQAIYDAVKWPNT